MDEPEQLTERQRKFAEAVARGLSLQEAAVSAGFSHSYSKKAHRLLQNPVIATELEAIRSAAREMTAYGLQEHVKEIDRAILKAYEHKAMMAVRGLIRDKGEAFGLYVHRYQEVPEIDLQQALFEARNRVIVSVSPSDSRSRLTNGQPATGPGQDYDAMNTETMDTDE